MLLPLITSRCDLIVQFLSSLRVGGAAVVELRGV